jgi:hypothetical protein
VYPTAKETPNGKGEKKKWIHLRRERPPAQLASLREQNQV